MNEIRTNENGVIKQASIPIHKTTNVTSEARMPDWLKWGGAALLGVAMINAGLLVFILGAL